MLAKGVGEWNCSMKFWMGPGAPEQTASGSCTESARQRWPRPERIIQRDDDGYAV
ncbi:MAG: DUF1579 family protein [bacterium]|nr:DUF1579 family protein [bacterium]